jgi:hypothetical protein
VVKGALAVFLRMAGLGGSLLATEIWKLLRSDLKDSNEDDDLELVS